MTSPAAQLGEQAGDVRCGQVATDLFCAEIAAQAREQLPDPGQWLDRACWHVPPGGELAAENVKKRPDLRRSSARAADRRHLDPDCVARTSMPRSVLLGPTGASMVQLGVSSASAGRIEGRRRSSVRCSGVRPSAAHRFRLAWQSVTRAQFGEMLSCWAICSAGISGAILSHIALVIISRTDTSSQPSNQPGGHVSGLPIPSRKFGGGDNAADAQVRPPGGGCLVNDDGAAGPLPAAFLDHRPHS